MALAHPPRPRTAHVLEMRGQVAVVASVGHARAAGRGHGRVAPVDVGLVLEVEAEDRRVAGVAGRDRAPEELVRRGDLLVGSTGQPPRPGARVDHRQAGQVHAQLVPPGSGERRVEAAQRPLAHGIELGQVAVELREQADHVRAQGARLLEVAVELGGVAVEQLLEQHVAPLQVAAVVVQPPGGRRRGRPRRRSRGRRGRTRIIARAGSGGRRGLGRSAAVAQHELAVDVARLGLGGLAVGPAAVGVELPGVDLVVQAALEGVEQVVAQGRVLAPGSRARRACRGCAA